MTPAVPLLLLLALALLIVACCPHQGRTANCPSVGRLVRRWWPRSPDDCPRWHRELFRRFWRRKARPAGPAHRPPLAPETISLIREMAAANRTWGAEHIRGELLKLHIRVAKRTIQNYMRGARPPQHPGQSWVWGAEMPIRQPPGGSRG